jgi:hypothetical protein
MSSFFMLAIAVMYGMAAVSFLMEGKIGWMSVALCWGIGNAVLAWMSR